MKTYRIRAGKPLDVLLDGTPPLPLDLLLRSALSSPLQPQMLMVEKWQPKALSKCPKTLKQTPLGMPCGLACGQHTGHAIVDLLQWICYSAACGHPCARIVARMKFQTQCFLHLFVLHYCYSITTVLGLKKAVFGADFVPHCVVELPGLL